MSQYINCNLVRKIFFEPASFLALVGVVFIAGKYRLVKNIDTKHLKGLALSATISGASVFTYNTYTDQDTTSKTEKIKHKSLLIACSVLCSYFVSKSLKDRITLTSDSCGILGIFEIMTSVILTKKIDFENIIRTMNSDIEKKNYSAVEENIKLILSVSPKGQVHQEAIVGFFEIVGDLFEKSNDDLKNLIPLFEQHFIQTTYQKHYLEIKSFEGPLQRVFIIHTAISTLTFEEGKSIINEFRNLETRLNGYLSFSLIHQDNFDELILLAEDVHSQLKGEPYSYIESGICIARHYLAKNRNETVQEKIDDMQKLIRTVGDNRRRSSMQNSLDCFTKEFNDYYHGKEIPFKICNRTHSLRLRSEFLRI